MSYQGPILVREPELKWPIVLLAAIVTAAIALVAAGMQYLALTQPYLNSYSQPRLEESLRAGNPSQNEESSLRRSSDSPEDAISMYKSMGLRRAT